MKKFLLGFLLSILIAVTCSAAILRLTILSPAFLLRTLDRTEYAYHARVELEAEYEAISLPANIPVAVPVSCIPDTLESDIKAFAKSSFGGAPSGAPAPVIPDMTAFKAALSAKLTALSNGATPAAAKSITSMTDTYAAAYLTAVRGPLPSTAYRYLMLAKPYAIPIAAAGAIWCFVAGFFLYLACRRDRLTALFISYAATGAALMLGVLPAWFMASDYADRVNVTQQSLRIFLAEYANAVMTAFIITALILFLLTIILSFTLRRRLAPTRRLSRPRS